MNTMVKQSLITIVCVIAAMAIYEKWIAPAWEKKVA
jgi:hypothetical protein